MSSIDLLIHNISFPFKKIRAVAMFLEPPYEIDLKVKVHEEWRLVLR